MNDAIGIADLAALVTVVGVSVYVAGLLGVAIALRLRKITDDMVTAWHAVALLPRTDVAGQGVRIWLSFPLPIALLVFLLDVLGEYFGAHDALDRLIPLIGVVLAAFFLILTLRYLGEEKKEGNNPELLAHFVAATFIATVGGLLMSEGALLIVRSAREANIPVLQVLTHGVFSDLIVFLVGSLLIGVAGSAVFDRPLPQVQVDPDPTAAPPAWLAHQLYLVTHAEGFWHFLDDDENELLSVPDRLVLSVHTTPKPPKG